MIKTKGFTLIEIALALVLIGVLISGGILLYGEQFHGDKINQTQSQLNKIRNIMLTFVQANGYLPCPDTDGDGVENRKTNGACQSRQGRLPGQTLGVKSKDAWGIPLYYRVNERSEQINRVTDICQSASVFGAKKPDGNPVIGTYGVNYKSMLCPKNNTYYCLPSSSVHSSCTDACDGTLCIAVNSSNDPRPYSGQPPYFHISTFPIAAFSDGMKNMTIKALSGRKLSEINVAVVVSFGQNGAQTWGGAAANVPACPASLTAEEQENCDNDRDFIADNNAFDDYLIGITLREVKKATIDAGYPGY